MPSVQLTLIRRETLVEYCHVKELSARRRVVFSQKCPRLLSTMQIYAASPLWPFVGRKCKRMCPRLCGIMIHRNVSACRRARGAESTWKFSQWPLLSIIERYFFPAFRIPLLLPFFFSPFLLFFFCICLFIPFSYFDYRPCERHCSYFQHKIALTLHAEWIEKYIYVKKSYIFI